MLATEIEKNKHLLFKALVYLAKIDGIASDKELSKLKKRLIYTGLYNLEEIETAINQKIENIDDLIEGVKSINNDLFINFTEFCVEMILADNHINDKEVSGLFLLLSPRLPQLSLNSLMEYLDVKRKVLNYEKSMFIES